MKDIVDAGEDRRQLTECHGMCRVADQGESAIPVIPGLGLPVRQSTVPDLGSSRERLEHGPEGLSEVTGLLLEVVQDSFAR